jgi:AraC-like DNA-binding protein
MNNYLVRAASMEGVRATIASLGGDADEVFRRAGMADQDPDPQAWLSYDRFLTLLEDAAQATHCPHFGLLLSGHQGINALGPVGFVIQQAPDIRSALLELTRHFVHQNQGANVDLRVNKGIAQWQFSCKLQGRFPVRQQEDLAAGIGVNLMRLLSIPNWSPDAVHFPHAPPENLQPYRRVFDCRLVFNADSLQMIFRADILDRPLNNADPRLHRLLEEHLSSLRSAYPDDYCGQVRHLISQALTTGDCSIERVASHLAMGKRTLQRQLKQHDASYKDLLEEVRSDIARRYLRESSGSLTALADMLCYSDLSTFSTAFRQQHGVSPREWRRRLTTGASNNFSLARPSGILLHPAKNRTGDPV